MVLSPSSAEGELVVRGTIRLALVLCFFATLGLLRSGFRAAAPGWVRSAWALGWLCYFLHVLAAFHVYHGWSHAHAFDHTEAESGFGPGIFVSYFFTLAWGADAAWWLASPETHARRPRWLSLALHLFFAFILFNGAVVFAAGPTRWASLAASGVLAAALLRRTCFTPSAPGA